MIQNEQEQNIRTYVCDPIQNNNTYYYGTAITLYREVEYYVFSILLRD